MPKKANVEVEDELDDDELDEDEKEDEGEEEEEDDDGVTDPDAIYCKESGDRLKNGKCPNRACFLYNKPQDD